MDPVHRIAMIVVEIEGARAERVVDAADHRFRKIRAALQHGGGRGPGWPFGAPADMGAPLPAKAFAADADVIAHRLAALEREIEITVFRIDRDRAGFFFGRIWHYGAGRRGLAVEFGREARLLGLRVRRRLPAHETGGRSPVKRLRARREKQGGDRKDSAL